MVRDSAMLTPPVLSAARAAAADHHLTIDTDSAVAAVAASDDRTIRSTGPKRGKDHTAEGISTLSFKGGYLVKPMVVETCDFKHDNKNVRFVYIAKKIDWMKKMAGGSLKRAGKIFDTLRDNYQIEENSTNPVPIQ